MRSLAIAFLLAALVGCATGPNNLGPPPACGNTDADGWVTLCVMPGGGVPLAGTGLTAAQDARFGTNNPNLKPDGSDNPLRLAHTERAAYNPHAPLLRIQSPQGPQATNRTSITGGAAIIITARKDASDGQRLLAADGRVYRWQHGGHSVTLVTP
jgi:hypothetical protein